MSAAPVLHRTRFAAYLRFGRGEDEEVREGVRLDVPVTETTPVANREVIADMNEYCDRTFVLKNAQLVAKTPPFKRFGFDSAPLPILEVTPGKVSSSEDAQGPAPALPPPGRGETASISAPPYHRADTADVANREPRVALRKFHVSADQLKSFKAKLVGDPDCQLAPGEWLSTNDCLCALMWKAVRGATREELAENEEGGEGRGDGEGVLSFPMNFRGKMEPRLNDSYCGNAVYRCGEVHNKIFFVKTHAFHRDVTSRFSCPIRPNFKIIPSTCCH